MVLGFSSQGIDVKGSSAGAEQPNQGIRQTSDSLGARGAVTGDKVNSASIQLAQIKVTKPHPQALSGVGMNYNKGGTFAHPKGLASVNRGGN